MFSLHFTSAAFCFHMLDHCGPPW